MRSKAGAGRVVIPGPGAPWYEVWKSLLVSCSVWVNGSVDAATGSSMQDLCGHGALSVLGIRASGRAPHTNPDPDTKAAIDQARLLLGADLNSVEGYNFTKEDMIKLVGKPPLKSPVKTINVIGHSRGGVQAIMAAWELYYLFPDAKVNIFALDPVPGSGKLSNEMTRLAPNVTTYVGVYAVDETSNGFNGVVPWPFTGSGDQRKQIDPLELSDSPISVENYHLIYAPGRHSTIPGNQTSDGQADKSKNADSTAKVGQLVDRLARACLKKWGTDVAASPGSPLLTDLKKAMTDNKDVYRAMRATHYPVGGGTQRGVTSSTSWYHGAWHYLEDSIGIDLTGERAKDSGREKTGAVRWAAIEALPDDSFSKGL